MPLNVEPFNSLDADRLQEIFTTNHLVKNRITPHSNATEANSRALNLTSSQERIWLAEQFATDRAINLHAVGFRLAGQVDPQTVRNTVKKVVALNPALSANFAVSEDGIVQYAGTFDESQWIQTDYSHLPLADREREARLYVVKTLQKGLELADGPLFRTLFIRLGEAEYLLAFIMHQLVADEFSSALIGEAFVNCYLSETVESFETTANEFDGDYSTVMDDILSKIPDTDADATNESLSYWLTKLHGVLPTIDLPTSGTRPARQTFAGLREPLSISERLANKMRQLEGAHGADMASVMLAGFYALLYRYTGQADILVGGLANSRTSVQEKPQLEKYIGPFSNIIGYRTQVDGRQPFSSLLKDIEAECTETQQHQHVPFSKLLETLNPRRDLSRPPLYQVMFEWTNDAIINLPEITCQPLETYGGTTRFDITLRVLERDDGLRGYFEYNRELFDQTTIAAFANHYMVMLEAALDRPQCAIDSLPMLGAREMDTLLVEWNRTEENLPKTPLIHQLFENQVSKSPDKIAVRFGQDELTYGELEQKASVLASYLSHAGVKPGVLVGVYIERSLDMMVGLLGILKAGGGYVPLDPAFPLDRLAYMVEDADVRLLLTQDSLVAGIFENNAKLLCLDTEWSHIESSYADQNVASDNPVPVPNTSDVAQPEDLAYVIYTSGSTGKPKGVQISHLAAVNFLQTMGEQPGISEQDVLIAVTTLSFDIALLELFLPLFNGAKVVIASREEAADGAKLLKLTEQTQATMLQATPATWRMLLDLGWQGTPDLRALCGGEAFPLDVAERLLDRCKSVWNMYGPTETTVWSTIHEVKAATSPIFIGRPIANTEIYILDTNLQPVPIGVPGILYIGGSGLARGYLNRQELTDEKFIAHPFHEKPGARIYNTGDMAKYHPDGTIECLGRIDHQVKVRGFRIELGEIEALLGDHPTVRQNVVVAREDIPGNKILVGYLVCDTETQPTVRDLREYLKKDLPDYMVPSAFVYMDELPLTPNGKVNRLALPEPESERNSSQEGFMSPRNDVEETLAKIWEANVNVKPIGINDDFFELGGTSLAAVRVFAQIERELGKALPLATLFDASTIAKLADVIRSDTPNRTGRSLVKIRQGSDPDLPPIFLCHGAGGAVLLYRALAQHLSPNQTVYGIQAVGLDESVEPHTHIEEMADYYLQEILQVQPEGPYLLGGYCMGGSIALELAQRLQQDGKSIGLLVMLETYNWINGREPNRKDKFVHTIEKLDFHLRNLLLSDTRGKRLFFQEKFEELVRRVKMSTTNSRSKVDTPEQNESSSRSDDNAFATTARVWELNDAASLIYQPSTYPGKITHVITRKQYSCYAGPEMGWYNLADDGVDQVVLNVYPAGMLNEPFVVELAETIQTRIDRTIQEEGKLHNGNDNTGVHANGIERNAVEENAIDAISITV